MSRLGLKIYIRPSVTVHLTSNLIVSCLCSVEQLCQLESKSVHSFADIDGRTMENTTPDSNSSAPDFLITGEILVHFRENGGYFVDFVNFCIEFGGLG